MVEKIVKRVSTECGYLNSAGVLEPVFVSRLAWRSLFPVQNFLAKGRARRRSSREKKRVREWERERKK